MEQSPFTSRELPQARSRSSKPRAHTTMSRTGERAPVKVRSRIRTAKKTPALRPWIYKSAICLAVVAFCLLLRVLPFTWAADTRTFLGGLFTYDLELDESLGQLKFVQTIFPGAAAVFASNRSLIYPVEGSVATGFGVEGDYTVFAAQKGAKVSAAAQGRVIKRGVHQTLGNYIQIEHPNNLQTIYYGLEQSTLTVGQQLAQGDQIGVLGDKAQLRFEVRIAGKARNPLSYLATP